MLKIAIILFPGINTEFETKREIERSGMQADFFLWNTPNGSSKLKTYDGYVIGGGFSYEDRGRAGVIASLDPIMETIKQEAEKGKPVLGICNGAQILVETGLIPGLDRNKLGMALARNKRIRDGVVLGTGYYNKWVFMKHVHDPKKTCMFTKNFDDSEIIKAPIAHGEGRFTTAIPNLLHALHEKNQITLRYCDENGVIIDNFPVNPNGSMFNAAAICNPQGNVMAVMPHLERDLYSSEKLFTSMRDSIMERKTNGQKIRAHHIPAKPVPLLPIPKFTPQQKSIQMFVSLIITDNEAETHELALKNLGFDKLSITRSTHFELDYSGKPNFELLMRKLIQSGVLLNTNKESATIVIPKKTLEFNAKREKFNPAQKEVANEETIVFKLLVRDKPDFVGLSKLATIQNRLHFKEIAHVRKGVLWKIEIPTKSKRVAEDTFNKLIDTQIFFNPHGQEAFMVE